MKKKEEVKVEYYDNGNKKRETHYKDGKEDGVTTYWHEDGTKSTEIHYKDGIPGVQTWWNKDGTKKEGVDTDWYEDGTKSRESHYKDGRLDGVATCWDEDGNKDMESHYKDGKLDGSWELSDKYGQLRSKRNYKEGNEIVKNDENNLFNHNHDHNSNNVFHQDINSNSMRYPVNNDPQGRDISERIDEEQYDMKECKEETINQEQLLNHRRIKKTSQTAKHLEMTDQSDQLIERRRLPDIQRKSKSEELQSNTSPKPFLPTVDHLQSLPATIYASQYKTHRREITTETVRRVRKATPQQHISSTPPSKASILPPAVSIPPRITEEDTIS
jgi:hypothetical protein